MKKFVINCNFNGQIAPFTVYIGQPEDGHHPLHFQSEWLSKERGGTIPPEVMNSIAELKELSDKNKVSFEELCMYALGSEEEDNDDTDEDNDFNYDVLEDDNDDGDEGYEEDVLSDEKENIEEIETLKEENLDDDNLGIEHIKDENVLKQEEVEVEKPIKANSQKVRSKKKKAELEIAEPNLEKAMETAMETDINSTIEKKSKVASKKTENN